MNPKTTAVTASATGDQTSVSWETASRSARNVRSLVLAGEVLSILRGWRRASLGSELRALAMRHGFGFPELANVGHEIRSGNPLSDEWLDYDFTMPVLKNGNFR